MTEQNYPTNFQMVKCKECGKPSLLNAITKFRSINADLIEWYLECPDCGNRTHTYFMTSDLLQRNKRLITLERIYHANPSPGRWQNVMNAKAGYGRAFAEVQEKYKDWRLDEAKQAA